MFNNTSRILPYLDYDINGVILPHSDKVLTAVDIDRRIEKVKSHINYLEQNIPQRNTHGGKRFRTRNNSLRAQIDSVSQRLELLLQAKAIIKKLEPTIDIITIESVFDEIILHSDDTTVLPRKRQPSVVDFGLLHIDGNNSSASSLAFAHDIRLLQADYNQSDLGTSQDEQSTALPYTGAAFLGADSDDDNGHFEDELYGTTSLDQRPQRSNDEKQPTTTSNDDEMDGDFVVVPKNISQLS